MAKGSTETTPLVNTMEYSVSSPNSIQRLDRTEIPSKGSARKHSKGPCKACLVKKCTITRTTKDGLIRHIMSDHNIKQRRKIVLLRTLNYQICLCGDLISLSKKYCKHCGALRQQHRKVL